MGNWVNADKRRRGDGTELGEDERAELVDNCAWMTAPIRVCCGRLGAGWPRLEQLQLLAAGQGYRGACGEVEPGAEGKILNYAGDGDLADGNAAERAVAKDKDPRGMPSREISSGELVTVGAKVGATAAALQQRE